MSSVTAANPLSLDTVWTVSSQNAQQRVIFEASHLIEEMDDLAFAPYKEGIKHLATELGAKGVVHRYGQDGELRNLYVNLQGVIELSLGELMKNGQMAEVHGYIHTPRPANPLVTDPRSLNKPLSLVYRTNTLRTFLQKGCDLWACYPQENYKRLSHEEMETYSSNLSLYSQKLHDCKLICEKLPEDAVGATYFFKDLEGTWSVFWISTSQVQVENNGNWEIALLPVTDDRARAHVRTLQDAFDKSQGPTLHVSGY